MRRFVRVRRLHGLGSPLIPDQFTTAAGVPEAFSPGTPDATIVQILQQSGQQLPPDIAAAYAAGQASAPQVSTVVPLTKSLFVAPGVWLWTRADGSTFYGDVGGKPVSYTPPPPPAVAPSGTPVAAPPSQPVVTATTTPAAGSQPTSTVVGQQFLGPPAVSPTGTPLSTVTGTPATPAPSTSILPSSISSMFSSLPAWAWLVIGGGALFLFSDSGTTSGRRR